LNLFILKNKKKLNPIERFVNGHFRSLLISRFNYTTASHLVRIRSCKILALVPPSHYDVVASTMFMGTGIWPYSKIFIKKRKKKGGKFFLLMLVVHISKLWPIFGNSFLWKSSELYYPCIDAADPGADYVFVIRSVFNNASVYSAPYLIEGIIELMYMMGFSARIVKSLSFFWNIKWIFTTSNCSSIAEHTTPMRIYAFGATNIKPFVSVFDK